MPTSPTRGKVFGFYDSHALEEFISTNRRDFNDENVSQDRRLFVAESLASALRHRFLRDGNLNDFHESITLLQQVTLPSDEALGTTEACFNPAIREHEKKWVQLCAWLESAGYYLGRRYKRGWTPSWQITRRQRYFCADYFGTPFPNVVAATRIEDGVMVWLKLSPVSSSELEIHAHFMSSHLRDDPRNACCPLLDFLRPPMIDGQDAWLLVMPALRRIDQPQPETVGEIARGLGQLAVGLTFMHEQNVAHRDICFMNIMVDASAMIPGGWCPYLPDSVFPSEDQPHRPIQVIRGAPVKYYFIDFGASSMFSSFEARRPVVGRIAQNQTVPELSDVVPYDPFKLDVRMFGDLIKQLQVDHPGSLSFLRPIVQAMTPDDPDKRVTVQESETLLKQLLKQRRRSSMLAPLSRHNAFNLSAWIKYPFMVATSRRQAQAVI